MNEWTYGTGQELWIQAVTRLRVRRLQREKLNDSFSNLDIILTHRHYFWWDFVVLDCIFNMNAAILNLEQHALIWRDENQNFEHTDEISCCWCILPTCGTLFLSCAATLGTNSFMVPEEETEELHPESWSWLFLFTLQFMLLILWISQTSIAQSELTSS